MSKKKITAIIISLYIIIFCIGVDTFLISPLIPLLTNEFNITISQGGFLTLSYALAYALFAFILGPISDRLGRRKTLLIGILSFTLCSFCCALSRNFYTLLFFRAFSGIAAAATGPQVWALIGDVIPFEKRGKVIGIVTSALAVSQLLGLPIGSYIAKFFNWNYSFLFLGGLSTIAVVLAFIFIPKESLDQKKDSQTSVIGPLRLVMKNRQAFSSLMVTFFMMFGSFGLFTFVGAWLAQAFSLNVGQIGTVMMVIGIGNMTGQLSGGFLADRFGKKKTAVIFMPIMATMLLLLPNTSFSLSISIITLLFWFLSAGISLSSFNAYVTELMPEHRGTIMSLNSSFMYMGTSTGVAINSLILKIGSFSIIGLTSFIAVVISWLILSIVLFDKKMKL